MYQQTTVLEAHTAILVCLCTISLTGSPFKDWHFSDKNIALNGTVIQKPATYCDQDSPHKCYPASLAVDGNTNAAFANGSCSATLGNSSIGASWTVNLGKPFNVTGIVIYNRDDNKIRLSNFTTYGDDQTLIHNSSGSAEYNETRIPITLNGLRSFSTITILLPRQYGHSEGGEYYLTLCEVQIYAAPRPACNVNKTKVANGQVGIYKNSGRLISHQYTVGTTLEVHCNENFHPDGPQNFQCLATGEYNHHTPKCVEACLPILRPSNGQVVPELLLYPENSTLKIDCDVGYETTKTDTIHCKNGGKWETPIPTCERVQCILPRRPDHGYYSANGQTEIENITTLPYKSEIIGLCDTGFVSKHYQRRNCNSDKSWSEQETVCTPVQCSFPQNITNAVYTFQNGTKPFSGNTFNYNTMLKVSCKIGYTLIGQANQTCQRDTTWSGKEPHCIPVTCDFPGQFHNGHYVINDPNRTEKNRHMFYLTGKLNFSAQIEAVCEEAFMLKSSSSIRICTATGIWNGKDPACAPVICKWPLYIDNGYYKASKSLTPYGMPYNTTLTATCNETYKLTDNYRSRRCNENAVWDNTPAVCELMCPLPSVTNGRFINSLPTQFKIGTTLRFTCDPGFTTEASTKDIITCQKNQQWSAAPVCHDQMCLLPTLDNGHFINASSSQYRIGVTLRFTCDPGFTPGSTNDTIICQQNLQWSTIPACQDQMWLLPSVENGQFINASFSKFRIGITLRFTCGPGFTPRSTKDTIICQQNLHWSTTPVCQAEAETSHKALVYGVVSTAVIVAVVLIVGAAVFKYKRLYGVGNADREQIVGSDEFTSTL